MTRVNMPTCVSPSQLEVPLAAPRRLSLKETSLVTGVDARLAVGVGLGCCFEFVSLELSLACLSLYDKWPSV